ncbi:Phosphatidylinositide phosphatase SAC2 [Sparganum proliferum]
MFPAAGFWRTLLAASFCPRGLHFEHVSVLLNGLKEIIRNMKFCWLTHDGLLSKQDDVFRVNCVDCLDRTNLVQSVFGSLVIETQLRKLGLLSIDEDLPIMFHRMLQGLWANNGDALSRQYTGTVAMKGDFTRTGLRTMNGLVRDGVSSVNRYYHRFGEIRRQAAIDFILGHTTSPELNFIQSCSLPEALSPTPGDAVMQPLLDQCRELCMLDSELSYFEFVATSANQLQKPSRYLDTIGMITDKYLHLVRLTILQKPAFQPHVRIPVEAIYKIVVGVESRLLRAALPVLQIYYKAPTVEPGTATEASLSSVDNVPVAETNAKPETGLSPDENVFGVRLPPGPQTLYAAAMQTASANTPLHATILHYEVAEEASEEAGTTTPGGVTDTEESDAAPSLTTTASEASRATARGQQPTAAEHYLSFRQPGVRLFNNTLIPISNDEEAVEALRAVADSLCIILKSTDHDVDLQVVLPPNRLISPKRLNPPPQFCFPLDQESLQANFSRLLPSTRGAGGILSSSRFWAVTESQLSMYEQDSIASGETFLNYDQPLQLTQTDAGRWPSRTTQLGRQLRFRNTLKNINTAIRSGINRMNIRPPRPTNTGGSKPPSLREASVESAPDTTYVSSSSSDLSQENVQSEGPDATNYERDTDDNEDDEAAAQNNGKELQSGGESTLDGPNSDEADATDAHSSASPVPRRSQGSLLHPPLRKPSLSEQTIPNLDSLRRDLLTRLIAEGQPVEDLLCKQQYQANEQVDDHVLSCGVLFRPVAGPGDVVASATRGLPTLVKSTTATNSTDGYLSSSGLLFPCCGRRPAQGLDTADYAVGFVDGVVPSEEGRFRKAVVEQNEGVSDYWHQMTLLSLQLSAVEGTASKSSGGDVTRDSTDSVLPSKNSDLTSEGEANDSEKKRPSTTNPDVTVSGEQAMPPPAAEMDGQEMPVSAVTTTATEPPAPSPRDQVLAQFKRFDNFCLPDIGFMNSPKLVEKLLKRQLENALDVEHQRRLMCPESQIRTDFIIF